MSAVTVDASELAHFESTLRVAVATIDSRARAVVRHHGQLLLARVKRNASKPRTGPPGPRIITGDYNRSITLRLSGNAFHSQVEVGTNRPQGRRLELGFTGVDAIGRVYDQPPYPHFGPAVDETEPGLIADLETAAAAIL